MDTNTLIAQGNDLRAQHRPLEALKCYAQAFVDDPDSSAAWNNYGNVMRECGQPQRAIPFLQHAIILEPTSATAQFNLAVALLQMGNYEHGWRQYETRWNYEHLAGQLPKYTQPRWTGQDLKDKTILVEGEQGHGDNIQFVRFIYNLHTMGAKIKLKVTDSLIPLFAGSHWKIY
jgi:tetratricopeptide (TPR) repeat protein